MTLIFQYILSKAYNTCIICLEDVHIYPYLETVIKSELGYEIEGST